MAKLPERVVSKEGKNRLGSQLDGQNRRSAGYPVPVLPGAREGRGSLEGVEIFQMRIAAGRFTPVCRSRCGRVGRAAGGRRAVCRCLWDHSPCGWFCVCRPTETSFRPGCGISSGEHALRDGPSVRGVRFAREGRGSLEGVEIFQMRIAVGRFTPVCRS